MRICSHEIICLCIHNSKRNEENAPLSFSRQAKPPSTTIHCAYFDLIFNSVTLIVEIKQYKHSLRAPFFL